jgi:hypothetical protein
MPTVWGAALLDKVGEGGAGVAFGVVAVKVKLCKCGVVILHRRVRWLERK